MVKDFQKQFNRLHILLDALVIGGSYFLAWYILFGLYHEKVGRLSFAIYMRALILIVPLYLLLNALFGLYAPKRTRGRRAEFAGILKVNTIGLLLFTLVLYLGSKNMVLYHFSRRLVVVFYLTCVVWMTIERNVIRGFLRRMRRLGFNQKNILLVGYGEAAQGYSYHGIRVIGAVNELRSLLERNALDEIAITLPLSQYEKLQGIVSICEKSGVHTKFIPDYYGVIPTIPYMEDVAGMPVINIRHVPLTEFYNAAAKRLVDIVGGIVGLIVFSPIMLLAAILVKISSPGPIIFKQERVGLHQKKFWMYKFRSMRMQVDAEEKKGWTVKADPRVTWIGRILRKTSLDETPQFFNIVRGDMSLVGPRPERPYFVEKFKEEIPHYMIKHQVRPGLTGWAQVNGLRGDTSIERRIEHDLYYIENWTLGFDFKIILLTLIRGFINKNAY